LTQCGIHERSALVKRILVSDTSMCKLLFKERHMATNLALDPDLIERAVKVSGEKTKKAAVTRALEEFITRRSQKRLADLMGKLEWDEAFDYKAGRSRR
jgi:Arc/MetJ family transcription regulator